MVFLLIFWYFYIKYPCRGILMSQKLFIEDPSSLGDAIKQRRKELKIKQKDLAAFCNLSVNGISRIETSQTDVKISTLLKISKMLGIKIVFENEE
jgi:ribosome-binding protein aMBF1 (putative translation factor)